MPEIGTSFELFFTKEEADGIFEFLKYNGFELNSKGLKEAILHTFLEHDEMDEDEKNNTFNDVMEWLDHHPQVAQNVQNILGNVAQRIFKKN